MVRPNRIAGPDGSRVQVKLGDTGDDYLLLLDEEAADGRKWQTRDWSTDYGGPPDGLCKQLNNLSSKGRYASDVAWGPDQEWYVNGRKWDGSGDHAWWGGTIHGETLRAAELHTSKISFGDGDSMTVLTGSNGHTLRGHIDYSLSSRLSRAHNRGETIDVVRLLPGYAYFISDDGGTEWQGLGVHLSNELKRGGPDAVLDVAVARDGSWVVVRPQRFTASESVSSQLTNRLSQFYRNQKARREARNARIREYDARVLREAMEQQKAAEAKRAEMARKAEEAARRREIQERQKKALKRRAEQEVMETIDAKRLRYGVQVTAVGRSRDLGDSFVVSSGRDGVSIKCADGSLLTASVPQDLAKIVPYEEYAEEVAIQELELVYMASDEYEAAVSHYHCVCTRDGCVCERTAFTTISRTQNEVSARPIAWIGGLRPFDEYRCAEKLDRGRLLKVIKDLRTDETQRSACLASLEARLHSSTDPQLVEEIKILKRCQELGLVANALYELTSNLVENVKETGCVIHEVTYEHRDSSFRGRLFAKGPTVHGTDDRYPRTATLQSMHKDLRSPLAGSFAHDIDCENSEYRLICSLATQMQLEHLVPSLFDYRDNRDTRLNMICQKHNVTKDEAKRLPNIILNSGVYKTWLRIVDRITDDNRQVSMFANRLAMEIRALRHELLKHPRFAWTAIEREQLRQKGKPEGSIDALLLPRIIQSCENEVLGIIQRSLHNSGWYTRAKVFDGLLVSNDAARTDLPRALLDATAACELRGWGVKLIEKPLFGLQDQPLATITSARRVLYSYF